MRRPCFHIPLTPNANGITRQKTLFLNVPGPGVPGLRRWTSGIQRLDTSHAVGSRRVLSLLQIHPAKEIPLCRSRSIREADTPVGRVDTEPGTVEPGGIVNGVSGFH